MSEHFTNTIKSIDINDGAYPYRVRKILKDKAPETLSYMGNIDLLNQNCIGFCGSRDVSSSGIQIATDCAIQAVKRGMVVVSGNARGVDRAVHTASLSAQGSTILVLPEGIDHFRIHSDLKPHWDWSRVLVISEFPPSLPWKTWNAMKRNKTILSLVLAMIVIEAGEKGGTIRAGEDALSMGIPLFVVLREDMSMSKGGISLLRNNGIALFKSKTTGNANMEPVFQAMDNQKNKTATVEKQLQIISTLS